MCGDREFSFYIRLICIISIGVLVVIGLIYYGGVLKLKGEVVDLLIILEGFE